MPYKTIINTADLKNNLDSTDFAIFDCRCDIKDPKYGFDSYNEGHIKNATFIDMDRDLASERSVSSGRHPLPDPDILCQKLSQWGFSNNKQAVVYDDAGGVFAGRMWWILRWLGHENVAVLNGGINHWIKNGNKLVKDITKIERNSFTYTINNSMQVNIDDVEDAQYKMSKIILDARSKERYQGIKDPVDPICGHVPGAISHPCMSNLSPDGLFRSESELKHIYNKIIGDTDGEDIISMCGSGVTACHNILALKIAGIDGVKLYVGSWSEWITDRNRPIAKIEK